MTSLDHADDWQRYWETVAENGRRLRLERAAADPAGSYLTADVPALADDADDALADDADDADVGDAGSEADIGDAGSDADDGDADDVGDDVHVPAEHFRDHPDAVIADARAGFEAFVEHSDVEAVADDPDAYSQLPVHLTAVDRIGWIDFSFADAVADANRLTTMRTVRVTESATRRTEAAAVTYRCPAGHETTVRQPLLRSWTLETCGESGCRNAVVPDDARTRARQVARFAVAAGDESLPCVVAGRYAAVDDEFARLSRASTLQLTGIARLVTDGDGELEPTYEVLSMEPTSP